MTIGVVAIHGVWRHLLVCVPEVDRFHVVLVQDHIGVRSVVEPEVVWVVVACQVALDHVIHEPSHTCEDVGPEEGSDHVKIRVDWPHDLVVRMVGEAFVRTQVGEGLQSSDCTVLHQREGPNPKDGDTRTGVCSPLSV